MTMATAASSLRLAAAQAVLEVEHVTHYRYDAPVEVAHHLAYLKPLPCDSQDLLGHDLVVVPSPMHRVDDVDRLLRAGADKVGVNTAAIARPELIAETADRFGAQVLVLSADVRRRRDEHGLPCGGFEVTTHGGRTRTGIDAVQWCVRAAELGAGEILLNSMDADGTKDGFDLELIRLVRAEVTVPVIASGGAGRVEHFAPAVRAGADAVLAASVFHFGELTIGQVKDALRADGLHVR